MNRLKEAWLEIRKFIEERYQYEPMTVFSGANYGWAIRYRKSGKSLCTLYPEHGSFTFLIVLGKEDSEEALSARSGLSPKIQNIINNTHQYHDGRWVWLRLSNISGVDDIMKLLRIKRVPKKT